MALEDLTGTKYIDSLNSSNPTATDGVSEGDDHIRGIKNVLKTTFPNVSGAVTATHTELNLIDGVTATTAELNYTDISANVITGYGNGVRHYFYNSASNPGRIDLVATVTQNTYESVGPTGSGADNIWTALDDLPSTCTAIVVRVISSGSLLAADAITYIVVDARPNGVSWSGAYTSAAGHSDTPSTTSSSYLSYAEITIQLNSSQVFDIKWNKNNIGTTACALVLVGFYA